MTDPTTLSSVGLLALSQGIAFLYTQAGDALKQWRERRSTPEETDSDQRAGPSLPAEVFEDEPGSLRADLAVVARLERELRELRAAVADQAQGIVDVDPSDPDLLTVVDELRRAMEAVYGRPITFRGEAGRPPGTGVTGEVMVGEVLGRVAGLRARSILGGTVTGRVQASVVRTGGEAVGLEVGTIGSTGAGDGDLEPHS
jgi:hypothetical protein